MSILGNMTINWDLVRQIAVPVLMLFVGKYLDRIMQKRPKLLTWFTHSAAFTIQNTPPAPPTVIHTHAIVIRNSGEKTATNVRVGHHTLPRDITIYPNAGATTHRNPDNSGEILFPTLVSGEQVTISYLYFPPLFWNQIHAYTKCDEGGVENVTVLPTPQPPKWAAALALALMIAGAVGIVYVLITWLA